MLTVADSYVSASWTGLVCSVDAPCVVEIALAVGLDAAEVSAEAAAAAADFGTAWAASRDEWQAWWAATFDPAAPSLAPWEGHLPVLVTADAALKRTYYMSVVALLGNARHVRDIAAQKDGPWDDRTIFATGGPVCAVAEMIIWDTALNSVLLSLLQPTLFASYLEKWLSSNLHEHLAFDIVSNKGEQKWYAFDDMMVFRGMDTLARLTGPEAVTATVWANKTVHQWMLETATYWKNLTHGCNTPACKGTKGLHRASVDARSTDVAGTWFGCQGRTPSASGCIADPNTDLHTKVTTMSAPGGGHSVHVVFPAGVEHKWWSVALGNESASGDVELALFAADGEPAAPFSLVGKATDNAISWTNTNTSWCRNGSSAFCTHSAATPVVDGLADYGSEMHLLECVPTYVHRIASLNAVNCWMMRETATVLRGMGGQGNAATARELDALAANVSALVRSKLYVAPNASAKAATSGGFWAAEQPNGELVAVRHVIDFISVATSLEHDLSAVQKRQMVGFVQRELLTEHWMRALSLDDESLRHPSANSNRKDHGPLGAYDGWPGETIESFCALGDYGAALKLARAMAASYHDGPGGQAHQVFTQNGRSIRPAAKAAADQQWFELSGAVPANRIISGLFGMHPPLNFSASARGEDDEDPSSYLRDAAVPRGFNGALEGVRIRGKSYTVTSGADGLSIRECHSP